MEAQVPAKTVDYSNPVYHQNQYVIRRKILKIFGASFHIYDMHGNLAFYSKQKALKLKEDIRVYGDQAMTSELLCIKARGVFDIGMTYDVIDSTTNQKVGSLRRKGLKSFLRDSWVILDVNDQEIGTIQEESGILAILRRLPILGDFLMQLAVPQQFNGYIGDIPVLEFTQNRNPFLQKITLDYGPDVNSLLDRRLGIAAAALICAIEGRQ
ncbi:MAG: hypothetical protein CMJ76_16450 [Planctomycetaceae bacterium]|nr:hypothetical protein [Planctomycetaceae bacterium]